MNYTMLQAICLIYFIQSFTAGENDIGTPKCEIILVVSNCSIFNIGLFSIAPCKVVTLIF